MSRENRNNKLMEIVTAIDGEMRINACILDLEKCNEDRPCPLHHVVYPSKSALIGYLTDETIESFSEKYESVRGYFDE